MEVRKESLGLPLPLLPQGPQGTLVGSLAPDMVTWDGAYVSLEGLRSCPWLRLEEPPLGGLHTTWYLGQLAEPKSPHWNGQGAIKFGTFQSPVSTSLGPLLVGSGEPDSVWLLLCQVASWGP